MGCIICKEHNESKSNIIYNKIKTFNDLQLHLIEEGLNNCELVVAYDFNKKMSEKEINYSKEVVRILGLMLNNIITNNNILALGYIDQGTFPLEKSNLGEPIACSGADAVISSHITAIKDYKFIENKSNYSLIPIIERVEEIVKIEDSKHILIIISTSQPNETLEFKNIIRNMYKSTIENKLQIVCINISDQKWDDFEKYDNFKIVQFNPDKIKDYQDYVLKFAIKLFCHVKDDIVNNKFDCKNYFDEYITKISQCCKKN